LYTNKNLLVEPELRDAINAEAAEMYKRSPKLYYQLARDAVVASQRLEKGVSIFDESPVDFETNSNAPSEATGTTQPPISTPIKVLDFEDYHEAWLNTATSVKTEHGPTKPIRAKDLLKFKTWNTKMTNQELRELLAEYQSLM
jgi:hypothetical protein